MADVNKAIVLGRLGMDPKFYDYDNGTTVEMHVATSRKVRDVAGMPTVMTTWHRVYAHSRYCNVDFIRQHVHTGATVYVEGPLEAYTYKNAAGVDCSGVRIRATAFQLIVEGKTKDAAPEDLPL